MVLNMLFFLLPANYFPHGLLFSSVYLYSFLPKEILSGVMSKLKLGNNPFNLYGVSTMISFSSIHYTTTVC